VVTVLAGLLLQIAVHADSVARSQVDSGFAGVVLIARGDRVLLERAYGAPSDTVLSTSTIFNLASITKSFTAAAILMLREGRRLSLSDSIGRFFPDAPADKRAITIRQLLTHTSGLAGNYSGAGLTRRDETVSRILGKPLAAPPGARYEYQDDDYELLAAIVEVVSGRSWRSYLEREVFRRAKLRHMGFQGDDWAHRGANGTTGTARDLYRWTRAVRNQRTFGAALARELGRPLLFVRAEPPFDIYYGYGTRVYVRKGRVVEVMYSGSGDDGHTSIARVMADGTVVIVLSTGGAHGSTTWASYVARLILPRATE